MPAVTSVANDFTKGLLTEFTGLNFPENACTAAENCIFTLVGDVVRRPGFDYETNRLLYNPVTITHNTPIGNAINTYKWNNAGGDGETQLVVEQIGSILYFFQSNTVTANTSLSSNLLSAIVTLTNFTAFEAVFDPTVECQFADGNGYLFVFHPDCDPIYVTYAGPLSITGTRISVDIRDLTGVPEAVPNNFRPLGNDSEHQYNLQNQGWTQGVAWAATSATNITVNVTTQTFTIQTGLTIAAATTVSITSTVAFTPGPGFLVMSGTVTSYNSSTGALVVNVTQINAGSAGRVWNGWNINPTSVGYILTFVSAVGVDPSNSDVWWTFKDTTGVFNPATTINNITLSTSPAPKGAYIFNAFAQQRALVSKVPLITDILTPVRPRTGTWFQGRVWYAGIDAQQPPTGDAAYYTWTENIYFSQIVQGATDFGKCYQLNDPTSETLFGLLPTDGGVITIQGSGSVYKLFPIQNGMLVFAANGIWFITGSTGIGFSADDYTVTKISAVTSISGTSFVDVLGLPYFWNEEGIYQVMPTQGGALQVNPITVGTIETLYDNIPPQCKRYVRGAYHPIDYVIKWTYNTISDNGDISLRYSFGNILNYNTYNKAFYPYTIPNNNPAINGILYISSPGGTLAPDPTFKYPTSIVNEITFSEERDDNYVDWFTYDSTGVLYDSTFTTGYRLRGQGQKRSQLDYLYVYSRADTPTSYYVQGLWDYASTGNSGRWSVAQLVNNWTPNFGMVSRRHKIRGRGLVLQLKFTSLANQPFDIMGWSAIDSVNAGT